MALPRKSPRTLVQAGRSQVKSMNKKIEFIERALAAAEGKISVRSGAATKLGISPSALEYKIRLLKINKHQFKKYLRESVVATSL